MDIGSSNGSIPITYETYKLLCLTIGISREWEIEFGYKVYLLFFNGKNKKAVNMLYYNSMYFKEGTFN